MSNPEAPPDSIALSGDQSMVYTDIYAPPVPSTEEHLLEVRIDYLSHYLIDDVAKFKALLLALDPEDRGLLFVDFVDTIANDYNVPVLVARMMVLKLWNS